MNRRETQWLAIAAALICLAVTFAFGLRAVSAKQTAHSARAIAASHDAKVSRKNGEVVISVSQKVQENLGLVEAPLQSARDAKQMVLPATVLGLGNLQTLASSYAIASAQEEKAEITASVSRREFRRLKRLYGEQQNVSAKAVEAAEGVYEIDRVEAQLARENLSLAIGAIRQNWGDVVAGWVARDTGFLENVLHRDDVLIEMTLPTGKIISAPFVIQFDLPTGGHANARRISAFPQMDPRVQGVSYLYITKSRPGLAPGLNLIARFGVGILRHGVVVPSRAVVWLHGRAWTFIATGSGHFVRHRVTTNIPVSGGWFQAKGFRRGTSVVTEDAQQVLAVELAANPPARGDVRGGRR